jgi:hypothetical protein
VTHAVQPGRQALDEESQSWLAALRGPRRPGAPHTPSCTRCCCGARGSGATAAGRASANVGRGELDEYGELELAGAGVPGMRAHPEGCPACREDRDSLRALIG